MLRRVWRYRDLLVQLVKAQYRLRYRQSFIGVAWAVLPTLATLAAGVLVFDRVARLGSGRAPYVVTTLAALAPWSFLTSSLTQGVQSVSGAGQIVTRLSFPRAILPLSVLGLALIDLSVSIALYVAFAYGFGWGLHLAATWFLLIIVVEIALTSGLVLLVSALNTFARDLRMVVPIAVPLWLFITPVMYPLSAVPQHLRPWFYANPMTGIVESARHALVFGQTPELSLLLPSLIASAAATVIGIWYFSATEMRFADVI